MTSRSISGDFDASFWSVTVLQISQSEPAVRYAILAVSSLHEALGARAVTQLPDRPVSRSTTQSFALQQYNKAISRLLAQMSDPLTKPLASLLTCVLFVCIEYMQGKDSESLIHLEQGRQLLARLDHHSKNPEMQCIVQHIVPLYTRLSLTSFLFGGSPVPIPDSLKSNSHIPDFFHTLDSMRHCMHEFMEQAFRFTQKARPAKNSSDFVSRETMRLLEIEQDRLLSRLSRLNVAFSLFRASTSQPGPERAILVLQIYLHAQHIWISTALSSSEVAYDDFLSSFAAIVPLAAAYFHSETFTHRRAAGLDQSFTLPSPNTPRFHPAPDHISVAYTSNFSFETHIIPPLYYVATKCRHPLIRRSALQLLNRSPSRRENLWRASVMGALAGHIVSVEERWPREHEISGSSNSSYYHISMNDSFPEAPTPSASTLLPTKAHEKRLNHARYSPDIDPGHEAAVALNIAGPTMEPALHLDNLGIEITIDSPVEPSLFLDTSISESLSHVPSLIVSLEDGYSSGPAIEAAVAFATPPSHDEKWMWPQQSRSQLEFSTSCSYETMPAYSQDHTVFSESSLPVGNCLSRSGSSDVSSIDLEEQRRYQHGASRRPVQSTYPQPRVDLTNPQHFPGRQGRNFPLTPFPSHLATEAPFGLPEEFRVHDAIIGPEKEDGSWVAIFRKLHGVDANWDVQHDWVPIG